MDFNRFKPGQKACIVTLDAPLVVSAGAGSGKTFTLTQRIAWALMEGSARDGGSFLDGIEQVMAITFTEKAAGEIKSRVKSTLRAEGMVDEALKVDDAWISTIHGMCSRILRTHAVELGIDPSFSVLDPARSDDLIRESVADALSDGADLVGREGLNALFAEFSARSSGGFGSDSVEDMLVTLVRTAAGSPHGCACFEMPPHVREASVVARHLVGEIEEFRDISLAQKATATRDKWLQDAEEFLERAYRALSSASFDAKRLIQLCAECPWPPARGSAEYKELAAAAQKECASLIMEARYLFAEPLLADLLRIAQCAYEHFCARKRDLGVLDNDDLLIQAAAALSDHDSIAREFADKFKIIMVDEFQDTDQLQIDMISRMAGEGGCRLCTVGDDQQSIYRFRGADVQVYKRHLAKVRAANPDGLIELPDNFRSHGDVLSFVDRIFEQSHVFGSEFMSLAPSRFESSVKKPFLGDDTRVNVLLTTYPERSGVDSVAVTRYEARRIANRFAELRDKGHSAGDMVILLGRMTRAGVFADALREAGFACVIAGGSIFSSAPEVRIMQALAEVIANPRATSALFELLSSEMFLLSADDFIAVSTVFDKESSLHRRRRIDVGLSSFAHIMEENPEGVTPQLAHAVQIVSNMGKRAGKDPVSRIMADVVRDSGWLARLEAKGAEGQSVAGNILKAIRVVESIEAAGCCGPSSVARAMEAHLETAKEAPGALSAQGGDFVRIMTVHASKGLEFPIVAVAEMGMGKMRNTSFSCSVIDGTAYVGLSPSRSLSKYGSSSPIKKATDKKYRMTQEPQPGCDPGSAEAVVKAASPMERSDALAAYESDQELQERRRLLYVALTRAKEALIMSMVSVRSSSDPDASGITEAAGIYDDVRSALFAQGDFPVGESRVAFGGSLPAVVERIDTFPDDYEEESREPSVCDEESTVPVPVLDDEMHEDFLLQRPRRGVASFTALSSVGIDGEIFFEEGLHLDDERDVPPDDSDDFWGSFEDEHCCDSACAVDVGTAFHMLAQQSIALREGTTGPLVRPDASRVSSVVRSCGLDDSTSERLTRALDRWLSSDVARRCESCAFLAAEFPFFVSLEDGSLDESAAASETAGRFLEGSVDLFAELPDGKRALVVDYKTGGRSDESYRDLYEKHYLQAACYAFAVLHNGYESVEALFVRVEQEDAANPGQPQVVAYDFSMDDLEELRNVMMHVYERWECVE